MGGGQLGIQLRGADAEGWAGGHPETVLATLLSGSTLLCQDHLAGSQMVVFGPQAKGQKGLGSL